MILLLVIPLENETTPLVDIERCLFELPVSVEIKDKTYVS
jgi:hypothetical protein